MQLDVLGLIHYTHSTGTELLQNAVVRDGVADHHHHWIDMLSDLNIGQDGDGFTVVQAMRKAHPNAGTFLLTGYPAFESALHAIHDEVDDYFVKPADIDSLTSTIERKLRARQDRP